jgi:hypothetical protein
MRVIRTEETVATELTVLAVPDCPNASVLQQRLAGLVAGRPGVTVTRRDITDLADAVRWGMHGSPTLLIDGRDPFAVPGTAPAVACRLYPAENGRLEGAPAVSALRQVLDQADARLNTAE